MIEAYRIPPKKEEKKMKYIYTIFSAIRNALERAWKWWSWENFTWLSLSVISLIVVGFLVVMLFGHIFLEKTQGECYLDSGGRADTVAVMKSIEWDNDSEIAVCLENDIECLERALKSEICK